MITILTSISFSNPGKRFKIETDRTKIQSVDIEICMISFSKKGPGTTFFKTISA